MTIRQHRSATCFLFCTLIGVTAAVAAEPPAPGTGRVMLALGTCKEALVSKPVLHFRDLAKKETRRLSTPFFGGFDYEDPTGGYHVIVRDFPVGDWELYNHEMTSSYGGTTYLHRSRADYSHLFKVEAGKVVDLGRFCAASQAEGETFENSGDAVFNTRVRHAYFVISANRPEDVERARKAEGSAAPLEVVVARPPRSSARPLLQERVIEPRMIRKPPVPQPMQIPR